MGSSEISIKTAQIKSMIEDILARGESEPFARANLESALAHIQLLYLELGLDVM